MAERPDFDNPTLWETHDDVNVFAEHARHIKGKDGKKRTVKFDKSKLERIAKFSNERDARGQPCPLMLGHTDDDKPETQQPPIVGYARKFKVAYDKRLGKYVIRARFCLDKKRAAEAHEYKRTSVEVWADSEFFDPIALLKRTPQLDLGQWTYSHSGDVKLRYSLMDDLDRDDAPPERRPPPPHGNEPEMDDEPRDEPEDRPEPKDGPPGVLPEHHEMFKKCCAHYGIKLNNSMADADSNGVQNQPPPRSSTPDPEAVGRNRRRRESQALRQQRTTDPVLDRLERMERMFEEVVRDNKTLAADRDQQRKNALSARLEALDAEGVRFDYAREERFMERMSDREQEEHVAYLRACRGHPPTGRDQIRLKNDRPTMTRHKGREKPDRIAISGGVESGGNGQGDFGDEHLDRATEYMKANPGCEWEEAEQYARGERSVTGELIRGRRGE